MLPDQIKTKKQKNLHVECSLIQTTPTQIVPAQCHDSCVPYAEHTAGGKTETGVARTENHPLCLVVAVWLSGVKEYSGCFPLCYLHPEPFNDCSEAGCHNNGCSQLCLPSSCRLLAAELSSDTCQGQVPSVLLAVST